MALKKASKPTVKFYTLTIDGEDYKLAYSFNAIADAETVIRKVTGTDCNLLGGLAAIWNDMANPQRPGASILRGLFYAALSVADPSMTLDRAGDLMQIPDISTISDAIRLAYAMSLPEPKEDTKKNEVAPEVESEATPAN